MRRLPSLHKSLRRACDEPEGNRQTTTTTRWYNLLIDIDERNERSLNSEVRYDCRKWWRQAVR